MAELQAASPLQARAAQLERLKTETFDLVVIGGGITGAGIARDAAMRGFKTALVERVDFAGGTSGKSARLVHGGLRYVETLEFRVVMEACAERKTLDAIAPHLIAPMPITLPIYHSRSRYARVRLGMSIYDALGLYRNIHSTERLSAAELAQAEPTVSQKDIVGAVRYYERRADDARLTLATIQSACRQGALALNYAEVQGLLNTQGQVAGVAVRDQISGAALEVRARQVVNASGVWNDAVRSLDEAGLAPSVRPNKGIHVIVPHVRLPLRAAVDFPAVGPKRTMYAVPWRQTCLIGTTDDDYAGDLDTVHALSEEVDWILTSANRTFVGANLSSADVISTYAGLRPLVACATQAAYRAPREHHISISKSGLISIAGGKLTTHRAMARDVVDRVAERLNRRVPCRTSREPLDAEAATPEAVEALAAGVEGMAGAGDHDAARRLVSTYGSDCWQVLRLAGERPELLRCVVEGLPYRYAEIAQAVENEMACSLGDVLIRRLRLIHEAPGQGLPQAPEVAAFMAPYLGWSAAEQARQLAAYQEQVALTRKFTEAGDLAGGPVGQA
jgi:glycerol-3-phosphate dehydrogenase